MFPIRFRSLLRGAGAEGHPRRWVREGWKKKESGDKDDKADKKIWGGWLPSQQGADLLAADPLMRAGLAELGAERNWHRSEVAQLPDGLGNEKQS